MNFRKKCTRGTLTFKSNGSERKKTYFNVLFKDDARRKNKEKS